MKKTLKKSTTAPKPSPPTEQQIKNMLGASFSAYNNVLKMTGEFDRDWVYYGPKYGHTLKILRKGKTLVWMVPQEGSLRLAFSVRDAEREVLLKSELPPGMRDELASAKRYPEGYPIRLTVRNNNDLKPARLILGILIPLRS